MSINKWQLENNSIIPTNLFFGEHGEQLDLEAIVFFCAAGFFAENDTYWKDAKWNELNFDSKPWHYTPKKITLDEAVDEFASLFHTIVKEQVSNNKVILPLSGGLDSRTLAVAMQQLKMEPFTYSYTFKGSFGETKYGKQIAKTAGWEFMDIEIPPSYMWDKLEASGKVNGCYSEFTHARQVAVAEELSHKGDIWLLGHWGDVLFDDMGVDSNSSFSQQVDVLYKKVLKKGGKELAEDLWNAWNLPGTFEKYLRERLERMHARIPIEDANARVRAFKSLYWATRWTSTNLHYFNQYKPMSLPYYDDRMCKFTMTIPENLLASRQIQIEYIKKYSPELAKVPWQDKAPYNLFNYHKQFSLHHLPYRVKNKAKYMLRDKVLGKKLIQRNWEIQFLGKENDEALKSWLFDNSKFLSLVPKEIVEKYYSNFLDGDQVYWSHPLSMLLTLSVFSKQNNFTR